MICGTFAITGMTKEEADASAERFRATKPPPTSVTVEPAADGTWTATAVFPPCADNVTHSTT